MEPTTVAVPLMPHHVVRKNSASKSEMSFRQALLAVFITPLRTIDGTDHFDWRRAVAMHLFGCVVIFAIIMTLNVIERLPLDGTPAIDQFRFAMAKTFANEYISLVTQLLLITLYIGIFEMLFMLMAGLCTAWGARDEPIRASFTRCYRRLLILTPHVAVVVSIVLITTIVLGFSEQRHRQHLHQQHPRPAYPGNAAAAAQIQQWSTAMEQWYTNEKKHWLAQPWSVRHAMDISFTLGIILWMYVPCIALAAVGRGGERSHCRWPALCQQCGYAIVGSGRDDSCPDCGLPVNESIGPDVRPGNAMQQRRAALPWRWCSTLITSILLPNQFARQIQVCSRDTTHRSLYAMNLVLLLCFAAAIAAISDILTAYRYLHFDSWWQWCLMYMWICVLAAWLVTFLTVGSATVVGAISSTLARRQLMSTAMRAAGPLSLVMVIWAAVMQTISTVELDGTILFEYLTDTYHLNSWPAYISSWLALASLGYMAFLWLLIRITWATRYANR